MAEHERDLVVLRGYYALKAVLLLFHGEATLHLNPTDEALVEVRADVEDTAHSKRSAPLSSAPLSYQNQTLRFGYELTCTPLRTISKKKRA